MNDLIKIADNYSFTDPPGMDNYGFTDPPGIEDKDVKPSHPQFNGGDKNQAVLKMQSSMESLSTKVKGGNAPADMSKEMIDSLSKISEPIKGQAGFSDGFWGPQTDAALHNIVNFCNSLLELSKKSNLSAQSDPIYYNEDIKSFAEKLTGYKVEGGHITLSQEDQTNRANFLTVHIDAISKLYSLILEKVKGVAPSDSDKVIQSGNVSIIHNNKPMVIPLSVLTSIDKYNEFCKINNLDEKAKAEILDLIIALSRKQ